DATPQPLTEMAAPRAANYRQVFCSSTVLHPSVILGPSPFTAQRTQDSERNTPRALEVLRQTADGLPLLDCESDGKRLPPQA
ncbi:hypothetical protein NQZ68_032312, partial [Dissostichus eleginoides]